MRQASLYTSYKKANLKNWINKHKKQKDALRASQTKKSHKSMENLKSKDFLLVQNEKLNSDISCLCILLATIL